MNESILKAARAALNELRKSAGGPPPTSQPAGAGGKPQPSTIPGGGKGTTVQPASGAQPSLPATLQPGTQPGVQAANNLIAWLNNNKGKSAVPPANH